MTDTPLSAEIQILLAAHRPGLVTNCDCEPGQPRWAEHILARAIDAQATEIAALKGALEAKEREMLAEHSSAMQALLRWCAEDTPEDIRKGWEQESHEALRALAAGRPR